MHGENRFETLEKYGLWVAAIAALVVFHVVSRHHYVVFHTIVELFAVVVACGIFTLAWNCRGPGQNNYLLFLGVAYLFVGGIDTLHALSYAGVNVFPTYSDDLATQLWIGARYIEALALLAAPVLPRKRIPAILILACFASVTTLLLLSIFQWRIFPACFVDGQLTIFKKTSEYIISATLLASIALLWRIRDAFAPRILKMIAASIGLTVASELSFTFYQDPYDLANELGHLLKLASFYLIYKAVIQTGIKEPFSMLLRDLKRSNEELESRNRELQAFARAMRHDLGNPLFSVEALTRSIGTSCSRISGTLREQRLDRKHKEALLSILAGEIPKSLESIETSVDMMKTMLEGLRQVATAGYRDLNLSWVDMNKLLKRVTDTLGPKITSSGASVTVEDLPPCQGDPNQLAEVFTNLLSNAVKYLDPDRPGRIRISGHQAGRKSVYCIEDNGVGIAPKHHNKVFELFGRVHPNGPVEGEGLGLTIVRKVVERHQGRVWFESQPGTGTRFYVALPCEALVVPGSKAGSNQTHPARQTNEIPINTVAFDRPTRAKKAPPPHRH